MRSLTPTALSILARPDTGNSSRITKCAFDPETHDAYATIESVGDGVEISLVKYGTGVNVAQHEVCLHDTSIKLS